VLLCSVRSAGALQRGSAACELQPAWARGITKGVSPEHERRFRRTLSDFVERPGGDHAELLRRGRVVSARGIEVEAWRKEIRASARADRIRLATIRDVDVAIAVTQRDYTDDEVRRELEAATQVWTTDSGRERREPRAVPGPSPWRSLAPLGSEITQCEHRLLVVCTAQQLT
jgi:hypothetical protein